MQLSLKAPENWKVGLPLYFSHPPAPLPEEMRRGKLSEYNSKFNRAKHSKDITVDNSILAKLENFASIVEKEIKAFATMHPSEVNLRADDQQAIQSTSMPTNALSDDTNEIEVSHLLINRKRLAEASVETDVALAAAAARKSRNIQISFGLSDSEED